jgi:hypothetical protein
MQSMVMMRLQLMMLLSDDAYPILGCLNVTYTQSALRIVCYIVGQQMYVGLM